jgi:hypothetical protein
VRHVREIFSEGEDFRTQFFRLSKDHRQPFSRLNVEAPHLGDFHFDFKDHDFILFRRAANLHQPRVRVYPRREERTERGGMLELGGVPTLADCF